MAKLKKVRRPQKLDDTTTKPKKRKQGHKLVWFTLIVIAIPCIIVGYVLLTSMETQNKPVTGVRFQKGDLDPKITKQNISDIKSAISQIESVEKCSISLTSATVRILVDLNDDTAGETAWEVVTKCADATYAICPSETYFTNTEKGKMYDLEINVYNWIQDDAHTNEGQIYLVYTKTGAGEPNTDDMNNARNWDIVSQIKRE